MTPGQQSIVITGTSRGLGRNLVQVYLERGWRVFGCSRSTSDIQDDRYSHFELDVADEKAVVGMFAAVRKSGIPLYALVNNAGIASMNHVLTTPMATVQKVFGVNVTGTILCCREAGKQMMLQRRGRIVNFGSVVVPYALEGEAVYTASKAAVEGYTRVLARELGDYGVTVNIVAPNPVKTDLIAGVPQEKMDRLIQRQSIKRYGTFEDVLRVIDFVLDSDNEFVTGQVIYLGGP
jgi:3-oxoacyl-[acyl-carrier protein] reductase